MGYINKSRADYIMYGDDRNDLFYIFKLDDLKDYIKNNMPRRR